MQRILLATDLTAGSRFAVERACALAARNLARLHIVHIVPSGSSWNDHTTAREALRGEAGRCRKSLLLPELELSIQTLSGDPVEAILAEAAQFGADLVVLGAHGEFRLREALFGTTATGIVRKARRPVLVAQTGRPWKKVMAAIDEDSGRQVVELAAAFSDPDELHIVHAFDSAAWAAPGTGDVLEDVRADQRQTVSAWLAKAAHGLAGRVRHHVERGEIVSVIMNAWSDVDPDLVVIGTHGRSGLAWLFEGSIAETVLLGCPADILVAPAVRGESGS